MMRCDALTLAELIAAIYRAAYDSSEWPGTIEQLRQALGGARACLVRIGSDMQPADVMATDSDPAFDRAFAEDARLHDNVFSRRVHRLPIGPVVHHDEIWDPDTLRRSPLWNEYLSPQEIHCGLMVKTLATHSSYWFVGASRSRKQQPLGEEERALMTVLAPHFRRAAEIGRVLEAERHLSRARAWSGRVVGLVTVDAARRIHVADATADAILGRAGCGLIRKAGRLEIRSGRATLFAGLVRQACRARDDPSQIGGGEMVAEADPATPGAFDVLLSIGPGTPHDQRATFCEPCALIALRALSPALPVGFAEIASTTFGLTAKEARIAACLAEGRSLQQAASCERVSINTARAHLNRIFFKTDTHQQSTLVALIRTIEPMVPPR